MLTPRIPRDPGAVRDLVLTISGLAALAVAIGLAIDLVTYKGTGYDLGAYVLAARRLVSGEALYPAGPFVLGPFGQFLYPPPVAVAFVPLSPLPFDVLRVVWLLAHAAVAIWVVRTLTRDLRPRVRYFACAGITLFFPLLWEISLGNLTLLTLALCLVAWRSRTSWPGAAALAGAAGLKLLALPLVPFFAVAGRGAVALRSVAVAAVLCVATLPFVAHEWPAYLATLAVIASAPPGTGSNIVPVLFASPALRVVLPVIGLAVVLACGVVARRGGAAAAHGFRVALAATPLVASTLWYPYLIMAVPLLVADAPRPAHPRLRPLFAASRPVAWVLLQTQVIREPGRDFILPFVGLLFLLAVGLLEVLFAIRVPHARSVSALARPAVAPA